MPQDDTRAAHEDFITRRYLLERGWRTDGERWSSPHDKPPKSITIEQAIVKQNMRDTLGRALDLQDDRRAS